MAGKLENLKMFSSEYQPKNKNGRKKGVKSRSTIAKYWLEADQKIKNPITGTTETLSQEDIMTLALIKKAREGDVSAYKALMDSGYGTAPQSVQVTGDAAKPIVHVVTVNEGDLQSDEIE